MSTELVSIDFHGDSILATRIANGSILVAVRRICESFGLTFQSQSTKLRKADWAGVTNIVTPDARGLDQETLMIPVDRLPMWMVTISPNKIRPELREKLIAYQTEAADVLAQYFMPSDPPPAVPPSVPAVLPTGSSTAEQLAGLDLIDAMVARIRGVVVAQAEQERRLAAVEVKADAALGAAAGDTGYMTLMGFCRIHKIRASREEMANVGWMLKRVCNKENLPLRKAFHEIYGHVNLYPVELLDRWRDSL